MSELSSEFYVEHLDYVDASVVDDLGVLARALGSENQVTVDAHRVAAMIEDETAQWFAARESDTNRIVGIVGLATLRLLNDPGSSLENLVVLPEHRRRGLGTALVEQAKKRADDSLSNVLQLRPQTINGDARQFFESLGFVDSTEKGHVGYIINLPSGPRS